MTTAHETSDAFSDETLREQVIFQHAKEDEMKEMLGNLADGEIEFYKAVSNIIIRLLLSLITNICIVNGRVGKNNTHHPAHTRGCLVTDMMYVWSHLQYFCNIFMIRPLRALVLCLFTQSAYSL